jgi:GTP cyclohydrolase I
MESNMNPKTVELLTPECLTWVEERYLKKYTSFDTALNGYKKLKAFAPDGNIWESGQSITNEEHYVMRLISQYYLTKAFDAMLIDLNDDNVKEDLSVGNIGTPGRIAKVWGGASVEDKRELGNGRWNMAPRIATFPNNDNSKNIPITKRVDVISNCSHHFLPFDSLSREDSYAIISYIPDKFVLGISKLQSYTEYISSRFFLQEGLTKALYDGISEIAQTKSVYVKLVNLVHSCESKRSTKSSDGAFTSEYYGGEFDNPELRAQVDRSI